MAFIHGKETVVTVNSVDLSSFTKSSDLNRTADSHDVTHYGADSKSYQAGLTDGTFTMEGTYDDGSSGPRDTLEGLLGAAAFTIVRQPNGAGTGKHQESFSAIITSYDESSPVDDMVTWSADFQISGDVTVTDQA